MADILQLTVEIVKAQAAQREMRAEEIEEYIRRTAAALRSIGAPEAAPPAEAAPQPAPAEAAAERFLTVEEAAKSLGRTIVTVYKYIHQGRLPAQRVGRSYRIRMEDLQALRKELRRTGRRGPRRVAVVRPRRRVARTAVGRRRAGRKA